jgi:flagellar biosynthesis regulator FlbT
VPDYLTVTIIIINEIFFLHSAEFRKNVQKMMNIFKYVILNDFQRCLNFIVGISKIFHYTVVDSAVFFLQ